MMEEAGAVKERRFETAGLIGRRFKIAAP